MEKATKEILEATLKIRRRQFEHALAMRGNDVMFAMGILLEHEVKILEELLDRLDKS